MYLYLHKLSKDKKKKNNHSLNLYTGQQKQWGEAASLHNRKQRLSGGRWLKTRLPLPKCRAAHSPGAWKFLWGCLQENQRLINVVSAKTVLKINWMKSYAWEREESHLRCESSCKHLQEKFLPENWRSPIL